MTVRKTIAIVLASAFLAAAPALAQQVGTATAVNPTSETTPPGGSTVALTVGARVVHKERIHTTPSGSAQLRFLDKSSLSIAPNTNILIDEFVYDPNSEHGHMLAKLTEGAIRYVGGELSHQGEVTISTGAANIGIRGGTVTVINGPNGTEVINHFGTITISNGGGTIVVTRPGFVVTITNWNTPPGQPTRVTAAEIEHYIKYLSSKFGQNGGIAGLNNILLAECGTPTTKACPEPPWLPTNTGENDAFQVIIQSTQQATGTTPPPPPPHGRCSFGC
jgi:FecR protein